MNYEDLIKYIEETDNDDTNLPRLEKAVEYYCSTWDKCHGLKTALIESVRDQYENHPEDQEKGEVEKLKDMLDGAI